MPIVTFSQRTDAGSAREDNEDAVGHWPHENGLLFAVADGLGGARPERWRARSPSRCLREVERAPGGWPVTKRLRRAVQEANLAIHTKGITVRELRGMATHPYRERDRRRHASDGARRRLPALSPARGRHIAAHEGPHLGRRASAVRAPLAGGGPHP